MIVRLQKTVMQQVALQEETGCWLWRGQIANSGHGRMKVKYEDEAPRMDSARNVSYRAFKDDIPKGMLTRPTCGNLYCVNPEHLELFDPEANRKKLQEEARRRSE